ncbi:MAG: type IV pilus modification protein PilV [Anaerolinea sp.]|nr:type IV pilus modification protein PilV [Anaerolinea sp.]
MATPKISTQKARYRKQKGATLIEILVAVLILSFGLLGMAALQARAVKGNDSAGQRAQATMHAQYMLDVLRVDREQAKGGSYNTGATQICDPSAFGGSTLADNTREQWLAGVKAAIGRPDDTTTCVRITCNADYLCTVRIEWDDSRAGGLSNQTLVLTSRV